MSSRHRMRPAGPLLLRTPLHPLSTLERWAAGIEDRWDDEAKRVLKARLAQLVLEDAQVRSAVAWASSFLELTREGLNGATEAQWDTLVGYVHRLCGRSTPLGGFAGVRPGSAHRDAREIELSPRSHVRRVFSLRKNALHHLSRRVRDEVTAEGHLLEVNRTLARRGDEWQVWRVALGLERRLTSLNDDPLWQLLVESRERRRPYEAWRAWCEEREEGLFDELLELGVLVPVVQLELHGPPPLDQLIEGLNPNARSTLRDELVQLRDALTALSQHGGGASRLEEVSLPALEGAEGGIRDLVVLDQVSDDVPFSAPASAIHEAHRAMELLVRLSDGEAAQLARFRDAFERRWEQTRVPLLDALDPVTGISWRTQSLPEAPSTLLELTDDAQPPVPRDPRDLFLLERAARLQIDGVREWVLSEEDLRQLERTHGLPPPEGLALPVTVGLRDGGGFEVLADQDPSSPSAHRLWSRWLHALPSALNEVRALVEAQDSQRPGALHVDLAWAFGGDPDGLSRPVLRARELRIAETSRHEDDVYPGELDLFVKGGRLVLWSRRLDREVCPHFDAAVVTREDSLEVASFLAALASQGRAQVRAFRWGLAEAMPFLPRVRVGNVILSRARWRIPAAQWARARHEGTAGLRARLGLPRWVTLRQADGERLVDLANPLSVRAAGAGNTAGDVVLQELFPLPERHAARSVEGPHRHELVVSFIRSEVRAASGAPARPEPGVRRLFSPGSEWASFELEGAAAAQDEVLRRLAPVIRALRRGGASDCWFFLRFGTEDRAHLRLRFHGIPGSGFDSLIPAVNRAVEPLLEPGLLSAIRMTTYVRELERYAQPLGIERTERLFEADSEWALDLLGLDGLDEDVPRWMLALEGVRRWHEDLGLSVERAAALSAHTARALRERLQPPAEVLHKLSQLCRHHRGEVHARRASLGSPETAFGGLLARRSARVREHLGATGVNDTLAGDLTHLQVLRVFPSWPQVHELFLHLLLTQLYQLELKGTPTSNPR